MIEWIAAIFFLIVVFFIQRFFEKKQQKRHEELVELKRKRIENNLSLIESINKLQVDVSEFHSLKRWMGTLMDRLEKHSEEMDQVYAPRVEFKPGKDFDLDDFMEEIQRTGAISIPDSKPTFEHDFELGEYKSILTEDGIDDGKN